MTAAVVALATAVVVLVVAQCLFLHWHDNERIRWSAERQALVDRVIARHAGEVVALDRSAKAVKPGPLDENQQGRPVPVGL